MSYRLGRRSLQYSQMRARPAGLFTGKKPLFVLVTVSDYVPSVTLVTKNKTKAVDIAKAYAKDWPHRGQEEDHGTVYFNQQEDGNMANAVQVEEVEETES